MAATASLLLAGCASDQPGSPGGTAEPAEGASPAETAEEAPDETSAADSEDSEPVTDFETIEHEQFDSPWALEFLPGTDALLITERTGALMMRDQESGDIQEISGIPEVVSEGQGGMHDVIAAPSFEQDQTVYLSWVRSADEGSQGVAGRAQLDLEQASLEDVEVIWEQDPASDDGHFALRLLAHQEHLYITSGDRQELDPAQDMDTNLGTIVRLTLEGEPAQDNPFAEDDAAAAEFWTTGHRNPLGIAADSQGRIWSSEMGPEGGDELNLITAGANYGWPEASMGMHYDGGDIPDHTDDDEFEAPKAYWVPAISPGSLMIYQGDLFTGWQDSAVLGGLSGENLVRVELDGEDAEPAGEWDMGDRIRAVEEAPDGAIWIATDSGDLLELRPE
ncbi:PQQ-dependent sugar dehydrogenase [Nesterenkonia muleiensis]|uniref:PQQ-dependent sugar dehydrogenase n=1 Tax=Nesterenkonia muleiensis TaxID=2282648 RepID=UPI001EE4B0C8|nr:PQQ-dependent sugar dehydrogenase [Nesterenkonia muleiensis]